MQRNHQFEFERIRIQKSNSNSNANSNQNTASHNDFGIPLKLITEAQIEQHYSQTQSIAETRRRGIRLDLGSRHGKRWRGHSSKRLTSIGLLIHGRTGTFFFCFASFIPTATQARLLASRYCILSCGGYGFNFNHRIFHPRIQRGRSAPTPWNSQLSRPRGKGYQFKWVR